jgi:hypothetical protein
VPTLIYLYGPPAVGKLTVAERLSALTGWAIFHGRCHHTVGVAGSELATQDRRLHRSTVALDFPPISLQKG